MTTDIFNVDELAKQAAKVNDLRAPLVDGSWFQGWDEDALIEIAQACAVPWDSKATTMLKEQVLGRFVRMLSPLGLEPPITDGTENFVWAGLRCILAAGGWMAHKGIAKAILSLYPRAPLDPDVTYEKWMDEIKEAHQLSGVPVTLALAPFRKLARAAGEYQEGIGHDWLRSVCALHVLKHLRLSNDGLRLLYNGGAFLYEVDGQTNDLRRSRHGDTLLERLNFGKPDKRKKTAPSVAVVGSSVLRAFSTRNLLTTTTMSELPPSILHGPWSGVEPASRMDDDFAETGLRLAGVWEGGGGKVRLTRGNEYAVLAYAWNIQPETDDVAKAHKAYVQNVPETYTEAVLPANYLVDNFPNMDLGWTTHPHGMLALYDAIMASGVVRYHCGDKFSKDFPLIWVMPAVPTKEGSTNNGKTVASYGIMHGICPGVMSTGPQDGESAPDNRAVANLIRKNGTLFLDDYHMVTNKGHILYRNTLQRLAVGESHSIGMVMENEPPPIQLRQCMLINAKCAELPMDLVNRSVFFYFGVLPPDQRAKSDVATAFTSGRMGTLIRMSSQYWFRKLNLGSAEPIGHPAFRFRHILGVALLFCIERTKMKAADALAELVGACNDMYVRQSGHFAAAEDSGIAAESEGRQAVVVRITDLLHDISSMVLDTMRRMALESDGGRMSPGQFIRFRGESDLPDCPRSQGAILKQLGLNLPPCRDRAVASAFAEDLSHRLPHVGDTYVMLNTPSGPWKLLRVPDTSTGGIKLTIVPPEKT